MLEFPGQVLELSMPAGRGTKGSPRALFDIISSSGRSPEELFLRSGNSRRPSVRDCPSVVCLQGDGPRGPLGPFLIY